MNCEICGAEVSETYEVEIEGTTMFACKICAKGKHMTGRTESIVRDDRRKKEPVQVKKVEEGGKELVDDYGERIRKAREQLGLPMKVLAERINETETLLSRVENQKTLPNDSLVRRIERELGIKLMVKQEVEKVNQVHDRTDKITLWDFAKKKESEKED